jgi:hypothetical protein
VEVDVRGLDEATNAKYWITFLVFSVLPAPLSPLKHQQQQVDRENRKKGVRSQLLPLASKSNLRTHVQRID